jgi:hypothetical protein
MYFFFILKLKNLIFRVFIILIYLFIMTIKNNNFNDTTLSTLDKVKVAVRIRPLISRKGLKIS